MGSWKNQIVSTEFLEERAKKDFSQEDLLKICSGDE